MCVFKKVGGKNEHKMNRLAAMMAGNMTHVEVVFPEEVHKMPDGTTLPLASSIWQNENIFLHCKQFAADGWVFWEKVIDEENYDKILDFCMYMAKKGIPFDKWGLFRAASPFPKTTTDNQKSYYCCEYVVVALKKGGLINWIENPGSSTPQNVYDNLEIFGWERVMSPTTPYQMKNTGKTLNSPIFK